jgi:1-acyl-sn-glycerol-3-phosphate acyltransferase
VSTGWKHPGWTGGLVYGVAATLVGGIVTVVSRLQIAQHRGRRRIARSLPNGPIIVISNHTSYADGVLLALVCRRLGRSVRLLATSGVFRVPVVGWLVRRLGFISVERGSISAVHSLDAAAEALAAGEAVGIFPEGRTTRDPDRWPERGKTGAVRLALRTGAPIVPVAIVGAHRVLDRDRPVRSLVSTVLLRPRVLTDVGDPIDVGALGPGPDATPVDVRRLTDHVMEQLIDLVEELRGEVAPHASGVKPSDVPR